VPDARLHPVVAALDHRTRRRGLTSRDIAATIGVNDSVVREWRRGRSSPRFPALTAWADAVDLHIAAVDGPTIEAVGAEILTALPQLRRTRNITLGEVATRRGVTSNAIRQTEAGRRRPGLNTLDEHLSALGLRLAVMEARHG
jgi:transcriptional regulator with XRE-family HTH domain